MQIIAESASMPDIVPAALSAEVFDAADHTLGLFPDQKSAADAVTAAAQSLPVVP